MKRFNGVKVFSATMAAHRDQLGEQVTAWLAQRPRLEVSDIVITQSSDAQFHCICITVFYFDPALACERAMSVEPKPDLKAFRAAVKPMRLSFKDGR